LSAEAEFPLLEAVTREQLVKTLQAGKGLAGAIVICEMWRSAVALYLLVILSHGNKWSINPMSNYPKETVDSATQNHDNTSAGNNKETRHVQEFYVQRSEVLIFRLCLTQVKQFL
jgi:hypothetical protein